MSDGSATLTVVGSKGPKHIPVRDAGGRAVSNLNALAYNDAEGAVYANVWKTTKIVVIDPTSGIVQKTLDIAPLIPDSSRANAEAVANGIAFHPQTGHLWFTGKYWDTLYELKI